MFENFSEMMLELFATSLWETIVMVGVSGILGGLIGIPLGVFLRLTDQGGVQRVVAQSAAVRAPRYRHGVSALQPAVLAHGV